MSTQQLTLWTEPVDNNFVLDKVHELKEKQDNLRRGIFQRYDNMKKEMDSMREELATIKSMLGLKNENIFI